MNRRVTRSPIGDRGDRSRHLSGDVVQFQIDEHRATRTQFRDETRSGSGESRQANLEHADVLFYLEGHVADGIRVGKIEGDTYRVVETHRAARHPSSFTAPTRSDRSVTPWRSM